MAGGDPDRQQDRPGGEAWPRSMACKGRILQEYLAVREHIVWTVYDVATYKSNSAVEVDHRAQTETIRLD